MHTLPPTMRPMPRNIPATYAQYPMHTVQSHSKSLDKLGNDNGLTFSSEDIENSPAAQAEYEVLRSILQREHYLQKLYQVVRTVGKKFKPEVADSLDLVRTSTVEVVENIVKWRKVKEDPDASFIWNGLHYLLKMPSDLDYLAEYLAIQKWMGFPLTRNPFCIPFPMESGVRESDAFSHPQHIEQGFSMTDGFLIGGTSSDQRKTDTSKTITSRQNLSTVTSKDGSSSKSKKRFNADAQSFIFNEDMKRIRKAEGVILHAEAKFGVLSRDPNGRLVPILQALTRKAAVELKKDDRRPLSEPSTTNVIYAPHAASSDVGLAEASWTPDVANNDESSEKEDISRHITVDDDSVRPRKRGEGKSGGALSAISPHGAHGRARKPIKSSISSSMDFNRYRNITSLNERIAEINKLKEDLAVMKSSQSLDGSRKNQIVRSALSNQMVGVSRSTSSLDPPPDHTIGTSIKIDPKKAPESFFANISGREAPRQLQDSTGDSKQLFQSANNGTSTKSIQRGIKPATTSAPSGVANSDGSAVSFSGVKNVETSLKMLKQLNVEETKSKRQLHYFNKDEEIIYGLKTQERDYRKNDRSRDIERKRRLLSDGEGAREGPPSEDNPNVYDYYAIRVQSLIRGWLVRCWVRWYRHVSLRACLLIQSILRGWFARVRVKRLKKQFRAAVMIQKNFRGWNTRGTSAAMARKQNLVKKSITIQRIWRGVLGVRRALSKRALDRAAKEAFDAVDAKSIVASDVKELARRIIYAIEEPTTTSFPPDEVLHLIRLTVSVVQSARGTLGLADYDFFNARHYDEFEGVQLTWKTAAKMVNRSERFIRLVRALAFGPGAKPPRLVQISNEASLLFASQSKNPAWCIQTFENMGMGSRICCQLFKWITSIIEIATRQQEFLSLIATSFPDWLPKLNDLQKSSRANEFEIELHKKCLQILQDHAASREGDPDYSEILEKEMKYVKRALNDARMNLKDILQEIDKLKNDQASREVVALQALERKVEDSNAELNEFAKAFHEAMGLAKKGDRAAQEKISELRHLLTNQRLKASELDAQRKLLELQIESNKVKRKDPAQLTSEILFRTIIAGEAKAAYIIAQVDTRAMLRASGVKHAADLPLHLIDIHDELAAREEELRHDARQRFVEADQERKALDDGITRAMNENDLKEQKSKDKMIPSEEELEEERLENEREAQYERMKHLQYLPDNVVYDVKRRPRPMIVAIARDVPEVAKRNLVQHLLSMLPGTFIPIDCPNQFGFEAEAMQKILDANQCIIMNIDHGLTRVTRDSFLNVLELTLKSLIPTPSVVVVVGNEKNHRKDKDLIDCGVSIADLSCFRDSKLKCCLEWLSWCTLKLANDFKLRYLAVERAHDLVCGCKSFALVIEAIFVLFHDNPTPSLYRCPDHSLHSMIWQRSRLILMQLDPMVEKMRSVRRGQSSVELLVCLKEYINHPLWPVEFSNLRGEDELLHIFATYVEKYYDSEQLTLTGGGAPLQSFTKSSMHGVQAVVTLTDSVADLYLPYNSQRPSKVDIFPGSDHVGDLVQCSATYKMDGPNYVQACAIVVRAVLQDLKVLKTVIKVNREPITITVYRDMNSIFFEAYDPKSSEIWLTRVTADEIPSLLVPNGHETTVLRSNALPQLPPATSAEMYERLVKLLKFEVSKVPSKFSPSVLFPSKVLVCKRDFVFLQQLVRRINGYRVMLKCFEGALGELFFQAYLPEFSAYLEGVLGVNERLILLNHADTGETGESDVTHQQDARPLLNYAVDRLRIFPTKSMLLTGDGTVERTSHVGTDGFRKRIRSQGLKLVVKAHGGAGRIIFQRVVRFFNVLHILEVRVSSPTKLLEISCYEPLSQHRSILRISHFVRLAVLKSDSDDYKKWEQCLMHRIRKDWHGNHKLYIDMQIYRQVAIVSGMRYVVLINAESNHSIAVCLLNPQNSLKFSTSLELSDFFQFLSSQSNLETAESSSRVASSNVDVGRILNEMKFELQPVEIRSQSSTTQDSQATRKMLDILNNDGILRYFVKKLIPFLFLSDPKVPSKGFRTQNCPLKIVFELETATPNNKDPLELGLRNKQRVVQHKSSDGSLDSVVAMRKQAPTIYLEQALDELALAKSKVAQAKAAEDAVAAVEVSDHMRTFSDADSLNKAILEGAKSATDFIMESIHNQIVERLRERNSPGLNQRILEEIEQSSAETNVAEDFDANGEDIYGGSEDRAIVADIWKLVLEVGIKGNFREGKVRWHGHISVKVMEDSCWVEDFGMGKRYKFIVYEPNVAQSFEGMIRSGKHLKEVLGMNGQDLLDPKKWREMLMFVSKYRMDVVVNKKTWDGADVEEGAPPYRIEFQSERIFTNDKVTPINAAGEEDEEANKKKMLDIETARGKKVVRLVRRVSGLLMQLTVFELPSAVAEASLASNPIVGVEFTTDPSEVSDGEVGFVQDQKSNDYDATIDAVGFAEDRPKLQNLKRFLPPAFRIVGYDPRSKRKVTLGIEPQAVIEVSGGIFSPYLHPERRRDLAKVVCDALILNFPSGRPFELVVPWSGSKHTVTTAEVDKNAKKMSTRSGAERVNKRPGRIFRAAMRISRYELVVSLYQHTSDVTGATQLIFNFYSPAVSEAVEVVVDESQQVERIGNPVLSFVEGSIRTAAIRRFCRFFAAEIIIDILDPTQKTLHVILLPPRKDFVSDYQEAGVPPPGEDLRPVGLPGVFFPLDTCGRALHRRGMTLLNRDKESLTKSKEFIVTVYTKSVKENPERGLVVKMYDRSSSVTAILHIGASELIRMCNLVDEPDLLRDLVNAQIEEDGFNVDDIEAGFKEFTEKGQVEKKTQSLSNMLVDIVLKDIGFFISPQDTIVPYIVSAPKGILPL